MNKRMLSVNDFCRLYGIGRTKTYELIARGELRARRVGNRTLIPFDDAEAWAAKLPTIIPKAGV